MSIGRSIRHPLAVRLCHWVGAFAILALLASGAEILAHHPELYWGETGFFGDPYILSFGSREYEFVGMGPARSVHFLAAWALVLAAIAYFVWGFASRSISRRLLPDRDQLTADAIRRELQNHLHLHADEADAAIRYNLLQKLAYLAVIFLLGPAIVLTGLAMSPNLTAQWPFLIEIWGGKQSARTIHFFAACLFLIFLLVHLWQVVLIGFRKSVGAMINGGRTHMETLP